MERPRLPETTRARLGLLAAFWVFVGIFGGTAIWLGARVDGIELTWWQAVRPALVAAMLWVPITLLAIRLARRLPVRGEHRARHGAVHLACALAASFALNFGFFAVESMVGLGARDPYAWAVAASSAGLHYLHVNALVYLVIVGLVHVFEHPAGSPPAANASAAERPAYVQRLEARSGGRITLLDVDDIEWIEADGDYACVHLKDAEHLVSERMKHLEKRLDPARFVRIHRSRIVNVGHVRELRHLSHGDYEVTLDDETVLRVSRGRRPELLAAVERSRRSRT